MFIGVKGQAPPLNPVCQIYDLSPFPSTSIHRGLESTDNVEVDAAIFATSCLCGHSRTFASGVCEKVTSMVQSEDHYSVNVTPECNMW